MDDLRFANAKLYAEFDSIAEIESVLRVTCPRLQREPRPLLALMTCQKARFFLPVFYSLCRLLKLPCKRVFRLQTWKDMFENQAEEDGYVLIFLQHLEDHAYLVDEVSEKFTFDTIVYCGLQYGCEFHRSDATYGTFVESRMRYWLEDAIEYLMMCSNFQHIKPVVLWIAKYCFPAVCTTSPVQNFVWDPFAESWCLITAGLEKTLHDILGFIWSKLQNCMLYAIQGMDGYEERKAFWLRMWPIWYTDAKYWALEVGNTGFKIHHDFHHVRWFKHHKILKKLQNEYTNVPELYFTEDKKLSFIEN